MMAERFVQDEEELNVVYNSFFTIFILYHPVKLRIEVTMLKFDLKEAIIHYAKEYCDMDVKVTGVNADLFRNPLAYARQWSIRTKPEIGQLNGYFFSGHVAFGGIEACDGNQKFLLNSKIERFEERTYEMPVYPTSRVNLNTFFLYLSVFCIAAIIYFILLGKDLKKEEIRKKEMG